MPKVIKETECRVIIEPKQLGNFGYISISDFLVEPDENKRLQEYKERCEEIIADVNRHVDNVGSVYLDLSQIEVCEFCGRSWTEDSSDYNGGCCHKDFENAVKLGLEEPC